MNIDPSTSETLLACAIAVRHQLEKRFISPDHILYDYVGLDGEILLPTPEECRRNQPNALGWWSPIENGAFFTGDFLLSQFARYEVERSDEARVMIRNLISGLYKLQDVCEMPGMIARGVGSDGRCHYPASSNDQVIPWLLGLWRYLSTDIPTDEERRECIERLTRQLDALIAAEWRIPGEGASYDRGNMLAEEGLEGYLAAVHLAIATKILADITGDSEERLHRHYLDTPLKSGKTRLDIIADCFVSVPWQNWYGWFVSHYQYAVRELYRRERDPKRQEIYRVALAKVAGKAAEGILDYRKFERMQDCTFTPDWRVMLPQWLPHSSSSEAGGIAAAHELPVWNEACPAVHEEKMSLVQALPAAWVVTMSEDPTLIAEWLPEILNALQSFDPDNIYYGAVFFVENVVWELLLGESSFFSFVAPCACDKVNL